MLVGYLHLRIMQVGIICVVYGLLCNLIASGCVWVEFMQIVVSSDLRLLLKFKKYPLIPSGLLTIKLLLYICLQFLPLLSQLQILELIIFAWLIYSHKCDL